MKTIDNILQKLAENDGNYIVLDLSGPPRMMMKDGKGRDIGTVQQALFDELRFRSAFLKRAGDKWCLSEAGKAAARPPNGGRH
ncbi:MAG: hypothetical protein KGK33_14315 [Hyphomicrobiales bacterium]|nr:hypothetical protein [Hyphomicrobiales bacterium]